MSAVPVYINFDVMMGLLAQKKSMSAMSRLTGIHRQTLTHYKDGTEPKYYNGAKLINAASMYLSEDEMKLCGINAQERARALEMMRRLSGEPL